MVAAPPATTFIGVHGGCVKPYGSTFLIFSDYMRPPIRLAALMGLHVIHVFTHDSIALGEDGPTHQPVEQLASLRPNPDEAARREAAYTASPSGPRCPATDAQGGGDAEKKKKGFFGKIVGIFKEDKSAPQPSKPPDNGGSEPH